MGNNFFIHSEDREILRRLYEAGGMVDIYSFHQQYGLSPGQVARVIRKYLADGYFSFEGGDLVLTQLGRRWLLKHRRQIFWGVSDKRWKEVPSRFVLNTEKQSKRISPSIDKLREIAEKG